LYRALSNKNGEKRKDSGSKADTSPGDKEVLVCGKNGGQKEKGGRGEAERDSATTGRVLEIGRLNPEADSPGEVCMRQKIRQGKGEKRSTNTTRVRWLNVYQNKKHRAEGTMSQRTRYDEKEERKGIHTIWYGFLGHGSRSVAGTIEKRYQF